jgi:hypothetical protein
VFSNAMAIAHRLGLNIVLSLREQTYVKQRTQPIFDAFDFDPIYIDPPEVLPVLSKRFFVSRDLCGDAKSRSSLRVERLSIFRTPR